MSSPFFPAHTGVREHILEPAAPRYAAERKEVADSKLNPISPHAWGVNGGGSDNNNNKGIGMDGVVSVLPLLLLLLWYATPADITYSTGCAISSKGQCSGLPAMPRKLTASLENNRNGDKEEEKSKPWLK